MFGPRMVVRSPKDWKKVKLLLRPYTKEEFEFARRYFENYMVLRYYQEDFDFEKVRDTKKFILWAVCIWEDGKWSDPIGHTNFDTDRDGGESGFVIYRPEYWGKGIASTAHIARTYYAFTKEPQLRYFRSWVSDPNKGSWKALEKMGYVQVGMDYGRGGYIDGELADCRVYRLLNPAKYTWQYHWQRPYHKIPKKFHRARKITQNILELAENCVEFVN